MNGGLAVFFSARLDEAQRLAEALDDATKLPGKRPDFWGCGGPAAEAYWEHFTARQALADVAADRELLAAYKASGQVPREVPADKVAAEVLEQVVKIRVARFAAHPGYRTEEWKP